MTKIMMVAYLKNLVADFPVAGGLTLPGMMRSWNVMADDKKDKKGSFHTYCAQDELQLVVALETPDQAARLRKQAAELDSGMGGMQEILLDQFVEKDYGDDLLLLTATEQPGGRLVGLIFWRFPKNAAQASDAEPFRISAFCA
ncbi:unnamed protein product [Symbiodinium sp. CCMP2592]|nr:unnamed protein product [Symbiodinium sp. CCMP2592]